MQPFDCAIHFNLKGPMGGGSLPLAPALRAALLRRACATPSPGLRPGPRPPVGWGATRSPLTNKVVQGATAAYFISPDAFGPIAVYPNRKIDRLSEGYPIALGARVFREVGDLVRRAKEGGAPGNPGCGYRNTVPFSGGPGGFQQRTHRGHREPCFEIPSCIRPQRPPSPIPSEPGKGG